MDNVTSVEDSIFEFVHNLALDEGFVLWGQIVYGFVVKIREEEGFFFEFFALLEVHLSLTFFEVVSSFVGKTLFENEIFSLLVVTCSHALTDMIIHIMLILHLQLSILLRCPHRLMTFLLQRLYIPVFRLLLRVLHILIILGNPSRQVILINNFNNRRKISRVQVVIDGDPSFYLVYDHFVDLLTRFLVRSQLHVLHHPGDVALRVRTVVIVVVDDHIQP